MNTKKFLFTLLDIIIVIVACYWCFWLVFYFSATVDGAIFINNNAYALFERNYLVPAQSFGIPAIFTILSVFFYRKMRKKKLIGKKYIILVMFNIIPLWIISVFQIINLIDYWNVIY